MTRLTALEICTNGKDIKCTAGGPSKENGKYVGWIERWRDGNYHKPLLNSEAIYDTEKDAIKAMKEVVKEIQSKDPDEIFKL